MKKYTLDGSELSIGNPFIAGGFKHPSNWAQVWTAEDFERWGITVEEIEDETPLPPLSDYWVCTARQARLALLQTGHLAAVEAAVAQADEAIKIQWEYATEIKRDDPNIISLATSIGIEDQLQDLFALAVTL